MSIVEKIRDAGIVGCGGAGFPTHAKLKGKIEYSSSPIMTREK